MALREEYGTAKPQKGARIVGPLHMTIQTAVLIETLAVLGVVQHLLDAGSRSGDRQGEHSGAAIRRIGSDQGADQEAYGCKPRLDHQDARCDQGVLEETTTGVNRLYDLVKKGQLPFPAINVNDSETKSKLDNKYGCKESLVDSIRRVTDTMMARKWLWSAAMATWAKARRRCHAVRVRE